MPLTNSICALLDGEAEAELDAAVVGDFRVAELAVPFFPGATVKLVVVAPVVVVSAETVALLALVVLAGPVVNELVSVAVVEATLAVEVVVVKEPVFFAAL
jgi:hypothetical protein